MSSILQITLKKVRVIENGKAEDGGALNALSATLYYPREGVPAITSVRSISLQDEQEFDYSREPFQRQLLFKELIRGRTILEVEITARMTVSGLEKFLLKTLGSVLPTAVGLIPGIGPLVTGVIGRVSGPLFEAATPKDKILVVGRGSFPIDENTPEGPLPVQLSVPTKITLKRTQTQNGQQVEVTKTLPKDFTNGMVTLEITKI